VLVVETRTATDVEHVLIAGENLPDDPTDSLFATDLDEPPPQFGA